MYLAIESLYESHKNGIEAEVSATGLHDPNIFQSHQRYRSKTGVSLLRTGLRLRSVPLHNLNIFQSHHRYAPETNVSLLT